MLHFSLPIFQQILVLYRFLAYICIKFVPLQKYEDEVYLRYKFEDLVKQIYIYITYARK